MSLTQIWAKKTVFVQALVTCVGASVGGGGGDRMKSTINGNNSKALTYLVRADNKEKDNPDIKIRLARVCLSQGWKIRAEKPLRQVLEADPANKEAMKLLSRCV